MRRHPILRTAVDSIVLMAIASVITEMFLSGVESAETRLFVDQCFAYTGYTIIFSVLAYVCFRESRHSEKKRMLRAAACMLAAIAMVTLYGGVKLLAGF